MKHQTIRLFSKKNLVLELHGWFKYFKDLNTDISTGSESAIHEKLKKIEKECIFNELDFKVYETEIIKAIKSLKHGKASGFSQTMLYFTIFM